MPPKKTVAKTTKPGPTKKSSKQSIGKKESGTSVAATKPQPPQPPKWTEKDYAAQKIQAYIRRFLAKKKLQKLKNKKKEYEELMERLENEAFLKLVEMERAQAEKERKKEEEERKRRQEEQKRRKRILEAAFDGDMNEIEQVLSEVKSAAVKEGQNPNDSIGKAIINKRIFKMVDCEDANKNTPLSEASSGGHANVIKFLVERGADLNSKGAFSRTPLYRAAFAGHLEAVQVLLQFGADPRIHAEDAMTPESVASQKVVQQFIAEWDIKETERLQVKLEADREMRREEDRQRRKAEEGILSNKVAEAEKDYKSMQQAVQKATCELNKRIYEHDNAASMGFDKPEITLQAVHDAEGDLEIAKLNYEKARDRLSAIKLELRDKQKEGMEDSGVAEELPGLRVMVRELDDVLLRDVGNRIRDSGKWPLIIDTSGQAATFLRYRDTNYLNALNTHEMVADRCRMALLGSLRYGKPLILDMMEVDMFETVSDRFDEIHKGLMKAIMDKTVMKEEYYSKLLRPDKDGPAYDKNQFNPARTEKFMFFIITKNPYPPEALVDQTYLIRVALPN